MIPNFVTPNLYYFICGTPVSEDVKKCLLSVKDSGKMLKDAIEERIAEVLNDSFFTNQKLPFKELWIQWWKNQGKGRW